MADIKKSVTDLVNFDVENNIHDEDAVAQLVDTFKDIVSEDDEVVVKFLQKFFTTAKELAAEFDLIANDEEEVEDKDEENNEETEETEETPAEEETEKSDEEGSEESNEENNEEPEDNDEQMKKEGTIFDQYENLTKANIDAIGTANRFLSDVE